MEKTPTLKNVQGRFGLCPTVGLRTALHHRHAGKAGSTAPDVRPATATRHPGSAPRATKVPDQQL